MKQKYQNDLVFIGLSILLLLLPLLLTAQIPFLKSQRTDLSIQKKIERASLQEIFQSNTNNRFSKGWSDLASSRDCNICQLKEVTCDTEGLVIALDLSNKNLQVLPTSIQNFTYLNRLHLHENSLKSLPRALGNMTQLEDISFFKNEIYSLSSNLRNLCGINVEKGLIGNPIQEQMTWAEFCRGI